MLKSKIKAYYRKHNKIRVCQGDILKDFQFPSVNNDKIIEYVFPYIVVISQDCDLENNKTFYENDLDKNNQFLPNILFLPAFTSESLRDGSHLKDIFSVIQDRINSSRWDLIKQNKNERYQYLSSYSNYQIPDLVIDFKTYFTLNINHFLMQYKKKYIASINELFRENLSQRFSNYLNRIGLPNLEKL